MDSSAVSGSSLSQMVRPIRIYSQQMDAFSLSWLCFSISLITPITLQLAGYLMLSPSTPRVPRLTVWLGIRLIFPRAFYKQPCVPRSRGLSRCSGRNLQPPRPCGRALFAMHNSNSFSLSHTHTQRGGQLFEYPSECGWSAAAHLQRRRRQNCLTRAGSRL